MHSPINFSPVILMRLSSCGAFFSFSSSSALWCFLTFSHLIVRQPNSPLTARAWTPLNAPTCLHKWVDVKLQIPKQPCGLSKNKKTEIFYEVCLLCLTLQIKEKTVWWRQSKIQIWKMNQVIRCERFRQNVKTFAQLLVGGNCHIKIPHNCQSVLFQKSGKNIHKFKRWFKITP